MATITDTEETVQPAFSFPQTAESTVGRGLLACLKQLASLKITVSLLAMAIFIIFVGTLAQTQHDIWVVVRDYFRSWFVWIPFQVFFPKSFFPTMPPVGGSFPFFGGWAIGAMMGINLVSAHLFRFRVQGRPANLIPGLVVIALGGVVTAGVIAGGSGATFQVLPSLDPSMRILWQLLQATFAGLVLLAGCILVFGKRAGIVVLHGGIGLMMFSELLVGKTAVEAQMHLVEGETVNFLQDIRTNELAVIDSSDPKTDTVVAIPQSFLKDGDLIDDPRLPFDLKIVQYLQNSDLRPVENGDNNPATGGLGRDLFAAKVEAGVGTDSSGKVDESAAYVQILKKGTGESVGTYLVTLLQSRMTESRERTGLSDAQLQARYRIGPFMLKLSQPTECVVDGKTYRLVLRFKRIYKPYSMKLADVRFDKYIGTETAKNYSSKLHLSDPSRGVENDVTIWMNNPLRYAGETFYQSNVGSDPITNAETTGLQVVTNAGWMIPYVSCMIVVVGLVFQFGNTLLRFLNRRSTGRIAVGPAMGLQAAQRIAAAAPKSGEPLAGDADKSAGEKILLAWVVGGFAVLVGWMAMPPSPREGDFDLYAAGKIPVVDQGRVKPLDSLARNTLQVISNAVTFQEPEIGYDKSSTDTKPKYKTRSAIRWLMDVISGNPIAEKHRVFRIDNPQVLGIFDLERRESHLYSLEELRGSDKKLEDFYSAVGKARKKSASALDDEERKLLELDQRIRSFTAVEASFRRPPFPPNPDDSIRKLARERRAGLEESLREAEGKLQAGRPPLSVPVQNGSEGYDWKPLVSAATREYFAVKVFGEKQPDPALSAWDAILTSYATGNSADFNKAVAKYEALLARDGIPDVNLQKLDFEAYFNHFEPFFYAWILYIAAFVIAVVAWLDWSGPLNRAAFWLILLTLGLHSGALVARIYISGRPPVTNLYSTAPFIGWACVIGGLLIERLYRNGIGNVAASVAGYAALLVSFRLAGDGDTFTVMQAVLDTQFWLATHVVCINLGYAPTMLAGLLGMLYIGRGVITTSLPPEIEKSLGRMIYGTLCFAIFFSFFGTVLGGLWADDSWGRFWGWDPKENGALMIVLWNALVLHARWDGLVKDRGMAVLAVAGNIITAWSWFGVNQLGVGLHSYGFTDGILRKLVIFIASQLLVIALGTLPRDLWMSRPAETRAA